MKDFCKDPEFTEFVQTLYEVEEQSIIALMKTRSVAQADEDDWKNPSLTAFTNKAEMEIVGKMASVASGPSAGAVTDESLLVLRKTFFAYCLTFGTLRTAPHITDKLLRNRPMPPVFHQLFNPGPLLVFHTLASVGTARVANFFIVHSTLASLCAQLPLVPGCSIYSNEMGPYCRAKFQHVPNDFWGRRVCGIDAAFLASKFHPLHVNLKRRHACETKIRMDQGLGPKDQVSIPWPGVNECYEELLFKHALTSDEEVEKWVVEQDKRLKK